VQALTDSKLVSVRVGRSDKTCAILIKDANGDIRSSADQDPDGSDPSAGRIEDILKAARDILAVEADTHSGRTVPTAVTFTRLIRTRFSRHSALGFATASLPPPLSVQLLLHHD